MTELSYFHNSAALGHAEQAPYDQELYASLTNALYGADGAWVLPNQLNNLIVATSSFSTIRVQSGRALIYGYWFENTANASITIYSNTSTYGRWDLVVAQVDTETGTGSVTAIQGVPGSVLSIPKCNTCETIKQLPLALIYVEPGMTTIHTDDIYDQRMFLNNAYHRNYYSITNDFSNGMFIAWGDSETSGTTRQPMPGWRTTGTYPATKDATRFDWMPYGRCVKFYGNATNYETQISVKTYDNSTDTMTFSMWLKVNSGTLAVSFAGTSKTFYACKDMYHVIFHRLAATGDAVLSLTANGTDIDIVFGDLRLAHGWCEAEMKSDQHAELVLFDKPVLPSFTVPGFTTPTFTGRSTGLFSLIWAVFGSAEDVYPTGSIWDNFAGINIVEGYPTKSFLLQIRANDSGSAATQPVVWEVDNVSHALICLYLGSVGNDKYRYTTGMVDTHVNLFTTAFSVTASGAGTFDLQLSLVGMVI